MGGSWGEGFKLPVMTKRWSTILADTGTTKIKLLKMDCEGCECDVLSDMRNMTTPVEIEYAVGECHSLSRSHIPDEQRGICRAECGALMDKSVFLESRWKPKAADAEAPLESTAAPSSTAAA